jgi:hypothetical protein
MNNSEILKIRNSWKIRSKRSYHNNKEKKARMRILNAIDKGKCVLQKTLTDESNKYNWSSVEKKMLKRCLQLRRNRYVISPEKITFINDLRLRTPFPTIHPNKPEYSNLSIEQQIQTIKELLSKSKHSDEYITFLLNNKLETLVAYKDGIHITSNKKTKKHIFNNISPIDNVYQISPNKSYDIKKDFNISLNICKQGISYLINSNKLVIDRNSTIKNDNIKRYHNDLKRLFVDLDLVDFIDLFRYPGKYVNIIQEVKKHKTVNWMIYLIYNVFYKHSCRENFDNNLLKHICEYVPEESADIFGNYWQILSLENKSKQQYNVNNSAYYDWDTILRIYDIIPNIDNLENLKDKIIVYIYTKENVLRDDLGSVEFKSEKQNKVNYNYIYKKINSKYVLSINNFKNVKFRFSKDITLSSSINKVIDKYIEVYKKKFKKHPKFLITQKDGKPYSSGKIGGYITSMFKRLTGASNLGINHLRHSFATYYKDSDLTTKSEKAKMMQHNLEQHILYERHSNKIIPIPYFDNEIDESTDLYIGKKVTVKINNKKSKFYNKILNGTVYKTITKEYDEFPYTIVFVEKEPKYVCSLPNELVSFNDNEDGFYWIGRRVKVKIYEGLNANKELSGTIHFNDKTIESGYTNTKDEHIYVVKYDDKSENDDLFTDLPDDDVTLI